MLRSTNTSVEVSRSRALLVSIIPLLLAGCAPRVATSFWRIGTPADSIRPGYAVLSEGTKVRHCYPITEWTDTLPNYVGKGDTYHSLHHHGVAVESELMAYRIYFDKKQTIDPYCKRTPQLELAQSHWYPNDSLLAIGYGDDILRVSGTVGVGSVKYWQIKNQKSKISDGKLCHIEPVAERTQRIVSQSRTSATIEVSVRGWQIPSDPRAPSVPSPLVDLTTRYTMRAGHRDLRCDVLLSDTLSGLCTGVQTIPAKAPNQNSKILNLQLPNGVLLASWGTDWLVNDTVKYPKETVGLAVFIPHPYAGTLVQDKSNNLCLLKSKITNQKSKMCATAHFYLIVCGATKENHPVATSAEEWFTYLRRWAKNLR